MIIKYPTFPVTRSFQIFIRLFSKFSRHIKCVALGDELLAYCNSFPTLNNRYTLPGDAFLTFLHISLLTTSIRTESLTPPYLMNITCGLVISQDRNLIRLFGAMPRIRTSPSTVTCQDAKL
ncbi:hypothetical protein H8356DRAFT_1422834 [Neocallimastix lanati (nom. inval.)]|nr:hypothetical protein H8356DRAFT_1422834 [Neocallimastix sp. JGI-2020a]